MPPLDSHPGSCGVADCTRTDFHIHGDPENPLTLIRPEAVDHPAHYGGASNPYEAIKVIEAWELGFNLGNAVKYISRAGKKDPTKTVEDLKKGLWYLNREIERLAR